jgi:hypothetical protein
VTLPNVPSWHQAALRLGDRTFMTVKLPCRAPTTHLCL